MLVGQQSSAKSAQAEFNEHSAGPTKLEALEVTNEGLSDGTNEGVSDGISEGLFDGL